MILAGWVYGVDRSQAQIILEQDYPLFQTFGIGETESLIATLESQLPSTPAPIEMRKRLFYYARKCNFYWHTRSDMELITLLQDHHNIDLHEIPTIIVGIVLVFVLAIVIVVIANSIIFIINIIRNIQGKTSIEYVG